MYGFDTRVTNSQQVLPSISQLGNAVLPTSDDHLRHLDAMFQNRNANPNPNANLDPVLTLIRTLPTPALTYWHYLYSIICCLIITRVLMNRY